MVVVTTITFILGIMSMIAVNMQHGPKIVHSQEELQARYNYLITHVAKTNVHPFLRPIHFAIGKSFAASGTLLLGKDGGSQQIITANHLFSITQPGSDYYDFCVVTANGYTNRNHISDVLMDSMRQSDDAGGIEDIAFAHIGEPGLINRTSRVPVSASVSFTSSVRISKIPTRHVTSLVTGEQFDIVGQAVNERDVVTWIMLYESVNGESGSGYWGDDKLYVLSGTTTVTERMRKDLDIPSKYGYVSVLSAVSIKW